jgi:hypothetical protein
MRNIGPAPRTISFASSALTSFGIQAKDRDELRQKLICDLA